MRTIPLPLRRATLGPLLVLAAWVGSGDIRGQGTKPESAIRDEAGMFDPDVVRKAQRALEQLEREARIPVIIETVESLRGESIREAALQRARRSGGHGVYILIARRDREISPPLYRRELEDRLPEPRRVAIRQAFIEAFQKGEFDRGLEQGVAALRAALAPGPEAPAPETADAPLVLRNQVRLTLAGARRGLTGAEAKATEMGLKVNIAVVDDGGHLLTFARMDGARPASATTALTKAITAATFRQATGPLPPGAAAPDVLLNLSLQNAAAASGGKLTTLYGGVPIVVEGQVIGAIGVGGGTGEQDAEIAKAGVAALTSRLNTTAGSAHELQRSRSSTEQPAEDDRKK